MNTTNASCNTSSSFQQITEWEILFLMEYHLLLIYMIATQVGIYTAYTQ